MRFITILLTGIAMVTGVTASAQTPALAAQLKAGAIVYDPAGAEAGTIESIKGDSVILSTGTNKLSVPPASFAVGAKGPVIAATRAQLDTAAGASADQAKAAVMAKIVPGAQIRGLTGQTVIGAVKSVEGDLVLVTTPKGDVKVPSTAFRTDTSGLVLGMTAVDFDAAVAASKGAG
jgi:hypothetical protein